MNKIIRIHQPGKREIKLVRFELEDLRLLEKKGLRDPGYVDALRTLAKSIDEKYLVLDVKSKAVIEFRATEKVKRIKKDQIELRSAHMGSQRKRKPLLPGPGDLVKIILQKLGHEVREGKLYCANGKPVSGCGCRAMQEMMNAWGYLGCIKRMKRIVDWFSKKAKDCGHQIDNGTASELISIAINEWAAKR